MSSTELAGTNSSRAPRRPDQRDARLPVAEMFDPVIARRLWESLPEECRVDHIDKKNMPDIYRSAIRLKSADPRTINFRHLPEPMTWEVAWLIYREIELGRYINPNIFNRATHLLRIATKHGTKRGRSAVSLLHLTPEEWVREAQFARMRGIKCGSSNDKPAEHRLRQLQDILVYPYHQGDWWELNVWNPKLDPRIPQREHEPWGNNVANFSYLTIPWLRDGAKLWLSASLSNGTMTWSSVRTRLDNLKWLQRHIDQHGDQGPCSDSGSSISCARSSVASAGCFSPTRSAPDGMLANYWGRILGARSWSRSKEFYQWMYDHCDEAATAHPGLGDAAARTLRTVPPRREAQTDQQENQRRYGPR